ncbi:MAG: peptidoglycan-binding protein [Cyanobacteria bacterium J06632_3]
MTATATRLSIGSSGPEVIDLQHLLLLRGGTTVDSMGPVDGNFGPKTETAIREFMIGRGLGHDMLTDEGKVSVSWEELAPPYEWPSQFPGKFLRKGDNGIEEFQQGLKLRGFYKGAIDGDFGPMTHAAVVSFQKDNTPVTNTDGVVGPLTYQAALRDPDYAIELQQNTKCSFITGDRVNIRRGPGTNYPVVTQLNKGDVVRALSREGDWVKLTARVYGAEPNERYEPLLNNPWVSNQYINGCAESQFDMWRS